MTAYWAPAAGFALFAMGAGFGRWAAPLVVPTVPGICEAGTGDGNTDVPMTASGASGSKARRPAAPLKSKVLEALRRELYVGGNPYNLLDSDCGRTEPDSHATHSTLSTRIVQKVLDLVGEPTLWLEVGSYIGSSAIKTAAEVKARNLSTGIVCLDPFVGDWAMWERHKDQLSKGSWDWLLTDRHGIPRIYATFLANLRAAGHEDVVLPVPATGTIGTKVISRLVQLGRLGTLPQVIYLDSAHEPEETLVELRRAWLALAPGGVLFGDDYESVTEVRNDVDAFAKLLSLKALSKKELKRFATSKAKATQPIPGLALVEGHWLLHKRA